MKKIILATVAMMCLCGTSMAQRHVEFRWRGIYFVGDAAYAMNLNTGVNDNGFADTIAAFMPSISAGFQFRKEASVGAGFSYLADPSGAFTQLPIFAELRSHFTRSRFTPYTVLQLGYSLPVGASNKDSGTKIEEGGLYFGVEVGGRYAFTRSVGLGVHAGYRLITDNKVNRIFRDGTGFTEAVTLHMVVAGLSFYFGNE